MKVRVKVANNIYEVVIESLHTRPILATVDGETFEVWPEEYKNPHVAMPISEPVGVCHPKSEPTPVQVNQTSFPNSTI
ncbi:MAG: hypothetical protein MUO76_15690, partial [Anaerolineaceae bacterium]|nr:hypothetical protein [Anaerolineaceae bacterium]